MTQPKRLLPDHTFTLGEGPSWDERTGKLYWVDIRAPSLHCLHLESGAHECWEWPEVISCTGLAESGEILVGGVSGIWAFDPQTSRKKIRFPIPRLDEGVRTNDGKVGPDDSFWLSTMQDSDDRGPVGKLMRIGADGDVRVMLEGITTANGLEFSLDGGTLYLSDTRELWIDAWDYDAKHRTLTNRRRFAVLGEGEGKPDGAALDQTGAYWVAGIYSGQVHRFSPNGDRLGAQTLPAKMLTMPCFGGSDLKTLFVTSLSPGKALNCQDGGLFSIRVEVAGLRPRRMKI